MLTMYLATVIGWYFVITSLLLFFRYDHLKSMMKELIENPGEFYIIAILTLIIGLLLVASHNVWMLRWPVAITIISWWILVAGLMRLFMPDQVTKMWHSIMGDANKARFIGILTLLIGLFLLYHVYYLHA